MGSGDGEGVGAGAETWGHGGGWGGEGTTSTRTSPTSTCPLSCADEFSVKAAAAAAAAFASRRSRERPHRRGGFGGGTGGRECARQWLGSGGWVGAGGVGVRRTCDAEAAGFDVVEPGHADSRGCAQLVHVIGVGLPPLSSLACHPARTARASRRRGRYEEGKAT